MLASFVLGILYRHDGEGVSITKAVGVAVTRRSPWLEGMAGLAPGRYNIGMEAVQEEAIVQAPYVWPLHIFQPLEDI